MPQRELFRKDTEKWMRKYDRTSYEVWINLLKPQLGKSLEKTESAIRHLRRFNAKRFFAFHRDASVEKVESLMRSPRNRHYAGTYHEAHITFGFLHRLALHHRRRLLRARESSRH